MTRRQALVRFLQFMAASPVMRADRKYADVKDDPFFKVASTFDMAKLAKAKLDPLGWDYIDEGSEDEAALRDNRRAFDNIIIRPHFLSHDVSNIDISTNVFA